MTPIGSSGSPPERFTVRLSPTVLRQLDEIERYVAERGSPVAASRLVQRVVQAVSRLEHSPLTGRSISGGVRELTTVRPYVIRYEVVGRVVDVLRIRHAARRPTE